MVEASPTAVAGTRTSRRRRRLVYAADFSCAGPIYQVLQYFVVGN